MRMYRPPSRKVRLEGWVKWFFVILIPISVFSGEAWLHARTLQNGYEKSNVMKRQEELRECMSKLRAEEAGLNSQGRIKAKAPDLGLVEPDPNQIQIVRAAPERGLDLELLPIDEMYDLARLGAVREELPDVQGAAAPRTE